MRPFQKIIKYGAIAFGIYLTIMIISIIVFIITAIFGVGMGLEILNGKTEENNITTFEQEYTGIEKLDIDLSKSKLEIKTGNTFKIEGINTKKDLSTELYDGGKELKIKDETFKLFQDYNNNSKIIIYIPENYKLKEMKIDLGVSGAIIEKLDAEKLELDISTGKCEINNINVKNMNIDSGTGETIINSSKVENLEFNGGVGNTIINSEITNKAKIEAGIGNIEINLIGTKENYKIHSKTGIGDLKVENTKLKNNEVIGTGEVNINVEAGIGRTEINFIEK